MLLNMHILQDELSSYSPEIYTYDDYDLKFSYAKIILEKENFDRQKQTLYVVNSSVFKQIYNEIQGYYFVVVGTLCDKDKKILYGNIIYIEQEDSTINVFNKIQHIFDKYNKWSQSMIMGIIEQNPIHTDFYQYLINIGTKMLKNPIAMFDISSALLFYAGNIPKDISNSIWQEVLTTGRYHTENLNSEYRKAIYKAKSIDNQPSYSISYNEKYNEELACVTLFYNTVPFATLGMANVSSPITHGQLSILYYLKKIIEMAYAHGYQLSHCAEIPLYFVESLIKGETVDRRILEYHLSKLNWKINDSYLLLNIAQFQGNTLPQAQLSELLRQFEEYFVGYIGFLYENSIIFIVHSNRDNLKESMNTKRFNDLLEKNELVCGISAELYNFLGIKYAYIQSKTSMQIEKEKKEIGKIYFFEEHYKESMVHALSQHTSLKSMIHPKMLVLWEDKRLTKEMLQMLEIYLLNGRNVVSTAKKLYVHRNTMTYRLNKLEELLEINLNDLDDNTIFWLQLSCIILKFYTYPKM